MKSGEGTGARLARELSLELPAAHSVVPVARRVIRHFARLAGLEHEIETLMLVTTELLDNAVDHGGGGAAMDEADVQNGARMRLAFELRHDGWELRVTDQGGGDPAEVKALIDPEAAPDLEDERGRGLYLLAQMVDRLEVERSGDGRGLTIVARRDYGNG